MNTIVFATDIDDTLIVKAKEVLTEETKDALKNLENFLNINNGIIIAATGRMFEEAVQYLKNCGVPLSNRLFPIIIADNGAVIYDRLQDLVILSEYIDKNEIAEIIDIYKKSGGDLDLIRISNGNRIFTQDSQISRIFYSGKNIVDYVVLDKFLAQNCHSITKIIFSLEEKTLEEFNRKLQTFKNKVTIEKTGVTKFGNGLHRLEITSINATKGNALQFLMKQFIVARGGLIVVGDDYNDKSMLKFAIKHDGIACVMGNATKELKDTILSEATISNRIHNFWMAPECPKGIPWLIRNSISRLNFDRMAV